MYCVNCGNEIGEEQKFCTKCGASQKTGKPPITPSAQPQEKPLQAVAATTPAPVQPIQQPLVQQPTAQPITKVVKKKSGEIFKMEERTHKRKMLALSVAALIGSWVAISMLLLVSLLPPGALTFLWLPFSIVEKILKITAVEEAGFSVLGSFTSVPIALLFLVAWIKSIADVIGNTICLITFSHRYNKQRDAAFHKAEYRNRGWKRVSGRFIFGSWIITIVAMIMSFSSMMPDFFGLLKMVWEFNVSGLAMYFVAFIVSFIVTIVMTIALAIGIIVEIVLIISAQHLFEVKKKDVRLVQK